MSQARHLGVLSLTLMTVAAVASLRNLPMMAQQGYGCIWFYAMAAAGYFLPAALICSECASREESAGGLYAWVKRAFGPSWGFLTMWMACLLNIAFLPIALAFLTASFGEMFGAQWVNNPYAMLVGMLSLLWILTLFNYIGLEHSARLNRWALTLGTLLPGGLIIALGLFWVISGQPLQIQWGSGAWMPDLRFDNLVFLIGVMLAFQGVEVGGYHAQSIKNPQTTYAESNFFSAIILLTLSILGSLSIAWVVPHEEINLVRGVMQIFVTFFSAFGLPVGIFLVGTCIVLGGAASLSTWISAPTKGMHAAAEEGLLPKYFTRCNARGVHTTIINWQSGIVSLLMIIGTFLVPDVEGLYWTLTALATQFALMAYILLFASAIVMKKRQPKTQGFQIPGGVWGTAIVGGVGIVVCVTGVFLGFVPPETVPTSPSNYVLELLTSLGLLLIPGILISVRYARQQRLITEQVAA